MSTGISTYSEGAATHVINYMRAFAVVVGFRFINHHLQYAFLKSSKDFIN